MEFFSDLNEAGKCFEFMSYYCPQRTLLCDSDIEAVIKKRSLRGKCNESRMHFVYSI